MSKAHFYLILVVPVRNSLRYNKPKPNMKLEVVLNILLIFIGIVYASEANSTNVDKCPNGALLPIVQVVSKEQLCIEPPCDVHAGSPAYITVNFTSPEYIPSIKPTYLVQALGLPINYPVGKDACTSLTNTICPLVKDEFVSYSYEMDIASWYPEISLNLQVSFTNNEDKYIILCFNVDLQVRKN
uniref:NPC intracellular cholesterol transporter 2-like n=1 Tax=Diabrotica virgifera virgifera TaxID=50390 RepID=A0A6P7GN89_DIAVI